ncbi:MAG: RHS repeat domain-containing protein [bacterium]
MVEEIITKNEQQINKYYVWGADLSQSLQGAGGIGGLLASVNTPSGNRYYYCYDVNGNVGQLVDASNGEIAAHYQYDSFGNKIEASGSATEENPFKFSTKYFDSEIELYYYGYRYCSLELGRWINRDFIEEQGGVNLYNFVGNNPVTYFEILGLWKKSTKKSRRRQLYPHESDHIWIAEAGDSLSSLAMKTEYGGQWKNWPCLWPETGTKDHGYPKIIKPCDKYNASNLASPAPNATTLELIVDTTLAGAGGSYSKIFSGASVIKGNQVAARIQNVSNEGSTPISSFVLAGHGGTSGTVGGTASSFNIASLQALDKSPTFPRARQKKGPLRCWFTRNAVARFSGCGSQTIANNFATNALRVGANAIGTTGTIGTKMVGRTPTIYWNPIYNRAGAHLGWGNSGNYYTAPIWATYLGKL